MQKTKIHTFGLIGYPLEHSFSPLYFKEKFKNEGILKHQYLTFPIKSLDDFIPSIKKHQILGLNVTIPYKEKIIPYLDELSAIATKIKAVNTIVFKDDKLIGYNTDVYGFQKSLEQFLPKSWEGKALILGNGGASKAVQYVLDNKDIPYQIVSRKKQLNTINYKQTTKSILQEHHLIINTTPLGMYPKIKTFPKIKYQFLSPNHYLYDLVYNPKKTQFLLKGTTYKTHTKSGHDMLIFQAEKSWKLWKEL